MRALLGAVALEVGGGERHRGEELLQLGEGRLCARRIQVALQDVGGGAGRVGGEGVEHLVGRAAQHRGAGPVGVLPLDGEHLVELEKLLAELVVVALDLGLRLLNHPQHLPRLERLVLGDAHEVEQPLDLVAAEEAEDAVLEREEEVRRARVALPARAAAQLTVDPARVVQVRADDVQPSRLQHPLLLRRELLGELFADRLERLARLVLDRLLEHRRRRGRHREQLVQRRELRPLVTLGVVVRRRRRARLGEARRRAADSGLRLLRHSAREEAVARRRDAGQAGGGGEGGAQVEASHEGGVAAEQDVSAAPSHVCRDSDGALAAGLGDHLRLALRRLGRRGEDLVLDAELGQLVREDLRRLDRRGPNQNRPAAPPQREQLGERRVGLPARRLEDRVWDVGAQRREDGRHVDHVEAVDGRELLCLGEGGARHGGELAEAAEERLVGYRRDHLRLRLHRQPLLGLDRLVQPVAPPAPLHHAAGELVDDDRLAALHEVGPLLDEELLRLEGVRHVRRPRVGRLVQVAHRERLFAIARALVGQRDRLLLLENVVVNPALEHRRQLARRAELVDRSVRLAGDDEGHARLVDQHRVALVNNAVVELAPKHHLLRSHGQVVAEIVEAELRVGHIRHVARVRLPPRRRVGAGLDEADTQPEEGVHLAHPLGVAPGEVVVDRHHHRALPAQRVEVHRPSRHQGLSLAGAHLRQLAVVQRHRADELHVVVAEVERAPGSLAHHRERLLEQLLLRLARREPLPELGRLGGQRLVLERLNLVLEFVDASDPLGVRHHRPIVCRREGGRLWVTFAVARLLAATADGLAHLVEHAHRRARRARGRRHGRTLVRAHAHGGC
mmetsp:Transcript_10283/g.33799  ORF Transcript_10283/g.33799 Transcript_10283/m.33799 type:complete len:846 (+) Transcript_10283:450-2987(+)